jgi:hypothetical protein
MKGMAAVEQKTQGLVVAVMKRALVGDWLVTDQAKLAQRAHLIGGGAMHHPRAIDVFDAD